MSGNSQGHSGNPGRPIDPDTGNGKGRAPPLIAHYSHSAGAMKASSHRETYSWRGGSRLVWAGMRRTPRIDKAFQRPKKRAVFEVQNKPKATQPVHGQLN
ncbi:hypothetical protein LTR09_003887 [Extremus antarcticus]|uniref:Uncharacterized protein n=1 Tax=Extremus antarcticus TaxID=702011 RepID=A0AAJ0GE10_9PEZI|nr:hypothetical protein LTR09_003887 [Extremus antarcticus]